MKAVIVGAGAQGRVALDILRAQRKYDCIRFADDNPVLLGQHVNGAEVAMRSEEVLDAAAEAEIFVALGNPCQRLAMAERIRERKIPEANAIHPSAVVAESACLDAGIMVGANAVINSNAVVKNNAVINTAAVVEHDCVVGEGAAVGPGARLGGRVILQTKAFIAAGAVVVSRVVIGESTVVGAGAVVTRDLPPHVMAYGVPASIRERLGPDFDWSRVL
jgi:sugar O-acyltransferase (sialic acid O-acetyltransferase NeuD family)